MKLNIKWNVLAAQISGATGLFVGGGALAHMIPGKVGLGVTLVAGLINTVLPHALQSAGVLQSVKQFMADSKAQKVQKIEAAIGAVAERKVDDLLRTQNLVRTDKGLVRIDSAPTQDAGSGIPNAAGTEGAEVVVPQDDNPAVVAAPLVSTP